ncbi:hypothetical protein H5410_016199 [Solanum commersonii]|uniref:Uncharacterized protein n=1 Tax=Solanum commersonii TaxID=4109 RepID=A0A9J5ZWW3_SOLCO|nr:hypothetical protein H5410_016199 [Solanum commersonii]
MCNYYPKGEVPKVVQQAYSNRKERTSQNVFCACDLPFVVAGWEGTANDSKILENALVEPTSQFPFPPHVLHNYLREYQSTDEIFIVYENENIVADDIDQQIAQSNNVGSSSRSHDREMQVQREEIVRTMWEDYIKD